MKTFTQYIKEVKKPTGDLKDACWTGYTAVGMKMKGGRKVPNCVPEEVEHIDEISKQTLTGYVHSAISDRNKTDAKMMDASAKNSKDFSKRRHSNITKLLAKSNKRSAGIGKALDRLNKEEKDHEYSDPHMAVNQLKTIMHNAEELIDMLGDHTELPEWVESKITLAEDYIMTVANYMRSEMHEETIKEDGMGGGAVSATPTNSVAGIAGSGDSRTPASQREPGVSKKHNPVMRGLGRRNPPKM